MNLIQQIFTGAGFPASNGSGRASFAWAGIAPYAPGVEPAYTSIVSGEITFRETASAQTYGTTAFNGFKAATPGTSEVTGTVRGYIQSAVPTPAPNPGAVEAPNSKLYWLKVLIGSVYIESIVAITDFDSGATPDEVTEASFNYTITGLPRVYQYAVVTGGNMPL